MRLLIYSDLHLEFAPFSVPLGLEYDVVVLAGDIGSSQVDTVRWALADHTFPDAKAIIYVPGNHEFYGGCMPAVLRDLRAAARGTRVHLLDGDEVIVDGVRFVGATLWTDFKCSIRTPIGLQSSQMFGLMAARRVMADYGQIQVEPGRFLRPEHTLDIHVKQRAELLAALQRPFDGPTVTVTHMAPHRRSLAPRYADDWASAAFVNELPEEFFEVPVYWIHGHTHTSFDYSLGNCGVICNPRGYRVRDKTENLEFNDSLIVTV